VSVALLVHDVVREHLVDLAGERLERVFPADIDGALEDAGERFGVAVEPLEAADHVFDLLPGDVLELHAGQRIHEHRAELAAALADRVENQPLAGGQALMARAQGGELLREAFEAVTLLTDVRVRDFVLELAFDDIGDGDDAVVDLPDRGLGLVRQLAHFVGDDGETASGLASAGRLDGGVEGEQVGLAGDMPDQVDQRLQRSRFLDRLRPARFVLCRLLAALTDETFEPGDQLTIAADRLFRVTGHRCRFGGGAGDEGVELGDHFVDRLQAGGDIVSGLFGLFDDAVQLTGEDLVEARDVPQFGHRHPLAELVRRAALADILETGVDPHVHVPVEEAGDELLDGDEDEQTGEGQQGVCAAFADTQRAGQQGVEGVVRQEDGDHQHQRCGDAGEQAAPQILPVRGTRGLGHGIVLADDQLDRVEQLVGSGRLDDPARGTGGFGFELAALLRFGGQEEDGQETVSGERAHFADQFDAVHARHVEVGDQEIDLDAGVEFLQRFIGVGGFFDGEAGLGEDARDAQQNGCRIIDEEDRFRHAEASPVRHARRPDGAATARMKIRYPEA
jgi:hypothetical protein